MHKLVLAPGAPRFLRECAVEAAAILGFRSVSMEFPILVPDSRQIEQQGDGLLFRLAAGSAAGPAYSLRRSGRIVDMVLREDTRREGGSLRGFLLALLSSFDEIEARDGFYADSGEARPEAARRSPPRARPGIMEPGYHPRPPARGLESLFEREFLVKDEDFDFLPDRIDASIALPEEPDAFELSAACDLAARLGMESLGLELPMLEGPGRPARGNVMRFERSPECSLSLRDEGGRRAIVLRGAGPGLAAMASALCGGMPGTGDEAPLAELREGLAAALELRSLDGQLAWLEAARPPEGTVAYCGSGLEARRSALEARFSGIRFEDRHGLGELAGRSLELPWELEACRELLEREVYPRIEAGEGTEILVTIGEDRVTRCALESEIREAAAARGAVAPQVHALGAFKQGLSWIRDRVLPELSAKGGIESVEIGFSAFLPAGRTSWTDEDGATPRITADRADDPEAWLDSPIRLVQELYPADDILAAGLGLNRDRITFSLGGPAGPLPGYRLVARGPGGLVLYEGEYLPSYSERPYLEDFPGIGKVHPGTGRILLSRKGAPLWGGSFKTDMESVWEAYQGEILPAARRLAEAACGGEPRHAGQPFFSRLVVEVEASEPDEELGCRQDRLSSLDSLHEDLYFVGLDYFQTLGVKTEGRGFDSPGLILPILRKRAGKPLLRYSILRERSGEAAIVLPEGGRAAPPAGRGAAAFAEELAFDPARGLFSPRFRVLTEAPASTADTGDTARPAEGGPSLEDFLGAYARLLSEGLLDASRLAAGMPALRISLGGPGHSGRRIAREIAATPPPAPPSPEREDIGGMDLGGDSLIGPDRFEAIAGRLARARGLRLRKVAESRLGRPIYAAELPPRLSGYVSRTKLVASRPSCYVNARHHANEVSSTNSALALLRRLLTDPAYEGIAERVNLVVLPLENADGAAIHAQLAAENPEWILHTARYDSLGAEFAREYWNDATAHTEALAFTRLWRDWLPDVVVDDHGVPTHEWCQQFSGYTSPWFKGFWMPRALLYGYFWHVTDEAYAANKALAEAMRDSIAERIGAVGAFRALNAEWRGRFEKYAHAWMPRLFPAEYHKDVIFYWVPYAYKPDYYYASVRFPWVTASSFVSEVADETARGPYLATCAAAHLAEDLAVIDLLAASEVEMESEAWLEEGLVRARRSRARPPRSPRREGRAEA